MDFWEQVSCESIDDEVPLSNVFLLLEWLFLSLSNKLKDTGSFPELLPFETESWFLKVEVGGMFFLTLIPLTDGNESKELSSESIDITSDEFWLDCFEFE